MIKPVSLIKYAKYTVAALLIGTIPSARIKPKVFDTVTKDVFELKFTPAHRLIESFENGNRHSTTIYGKKFYEVYYGKADKIADKIRNVKDDILLTVGHGHSQRKAVDLANGQAKLGDYVSKNLADSLFVEDVSAVKKVLDNNIKVKLKPHQEKAILSYGFNADVETFAKSDSTRVIKESLFECINNGQLGKAQSKFNIITAGGVEQAGLIKRRLVEMIIFGDGQIYESKYSQAAFKKLVKKLYEKDQSGFDEVSKKLEEQSISPKKLEALKAKAEKIVKAK